MMRSWFSWLLTVVLLALALPGPAQAQTFSDCRAETYTVRAGDSLYTIAESCDISYMGLVGINYQLSDPDKLWPGQVIRLVAGADLGLPTPAGGAPVEGGLQENRIYLVRPGDSLARIAYLHNTTIDALIALNPAVGPDHILYTGQRILLPSDARLEKGWLGVNIRNPSRAERITVRVQDFPPYAQLEFRLGELDEEPTTITEATADARGNAEIYMWIPLSAWYDEVWVVEVVTPAAIRPVRALSPTMIVE
jgi:LysM repeat protein